MGREVWIAISPGTDESDVALEMQVRIGGPLGKTCRDRSSSLKSYFRSGLEVTFVPDLGEKVGIRCLLEHEDAQGRGDFRLKLRWVDAAGNAGAWSAWFNLPRGAEPWRRIEEFEKL